MGRLIDVDALIEVIKNLSYFNADDMQELVASQPTAYDVEKVVAELEDKLLSSSDAHAEAITGMCGASANVYYGEKSAYTSAIDIVRKGGVE